jgi:outer membrane biogenesis lipoprotein LolB
MKKAMILVISAVILIAGGYFTMEYLKQKEKEEEFWKVQEARVEKYIHYNIEGVNRLRLQKKL